MSEVKQTVFKILKVLGILVVVGVVGLAALCGFVYYKQNEPFPAGQLQIADGALLYQKNYSGNLIPNPPTSYRVRITNKGTVAAKAIKFRVDFFNANESPIDGREITFYDVIPPGSTRTIDATLYDVKRLPKGWKYSAQFVDAMKVSMFD